MDRLTAKPGQESDPKVLGMDAIADYQTLDRVFANIHVAIGYTDREFYYLRVNRAFTESTGYPPEFFIGKNHFELFPDERVRPVYQRVVETGEPYRAVDTPYRHPDHPDEEVSYWDWGLEPARDISGEIAGLIITAVNVTKRHQGDQALRQSQEMFRSLFESAPDVNLLIDRSRTIRAANQRVEKLLGYTPDELVGLPIDRLVQGFPKESLSDDGQSSSPGGLSLDCTAVDKSGTHIPVDITLGPLQAQSEDLMICVIRDNTRRKLAEGAQIKQAETIRLLRDIAIAANEATTPDHAISLALREICGFTGWPLGHALIKNDGEGLQSSNIWFMVPPDHFQAFRQASEELKVLPGAELPGDVLNTGQPLWLDHLAEQPNFWRSQAAQAAGLKTAILVPILARRKVVTILEFYSDQDLEVNPALLEILSQVANQLGRIIERVAAEQALAKSEARQRAIFTHSGIGIKILDLNGNILESNTAFQQMLGYRPDEMHGLRYQDITYPDDVSAYASRFISLARGEIESYQYEKRYTRKDGQIIWGRQVLSLVRGANGEPQFIVGMVEDITRRKEIEAELLELQHRLLESAESERLRLAQELHDGPIQDLYGASFQLQELEETAPDKQTQAGIFETRQTVQQVIASLRVTCGEMRPPTLAPFGLEKAIRSHAEHFHEQHPEIKLVLDLENDGKALSEHTRLALFRIYQQMLSNMLRHAQATQFTVRLCLKQDSVILEGQDNGCGFTLPNRWIELARQGHLGIVGSMERAEALGGRLEVETAPGQGTLIRAIVPRTAA